MFYNSSKLKASLMNIICLKNDSKARGDAESW